MRFCLPSLPRLRSVLRCVLPMHACPLGTAGSACSGVSSGSKSGSSSMACGQVTGAEVEQRRLQFFRGDFLQISTDFGARFGESISGKSVCLSAFPAFSFRGHLGGRHQCRPSSEGWGVEEGLPRTLLMKVSLVFPHSILSLAVWCQV